MWNMNNMTYIGIGVLIVIIIVGVLIFTGGANSASQTTTANSQATTATSSQATTAASPSTTIGGVNTSAANNTYKSTTTVLSSNTTIVAARGCTASNYFTCSNVVYSYAGANAVSHINATVGQDTGQGWSGFGIGYAPEGAAVSGGIPEIMFYTASDSVNNVGTSLATGTWVNITIPVTKLGASTIGTLWVCYVNSGTLYIGNGCTTSGGSPATYQVLGKVNLTS